METTLTQDPKIAFIKETVTQRMAELIIDTDECNRIVNRMGIDGYDEKIEKKIISQIKKNGVLYSFLKDVKMYLDTNPRYEFCVKQLEELLGKEKIRLAEFPGYDKAPTSAKKEFDKIFQLNLIRDQIKTLKFICE